MNCRRATQLLSEAMDRELSFAERVSLWVHLKLCTSCRRYRRQLMLLREVVRQFAGWIDETTTPPGTALPAAARQRIRDAISASG